MRARTRSLVPLAVLLAAAAGAVAFAWFGVERKDAGEARRKEDGARLYRFDPAKVRRLTVEAKGEATRLARAGPDAPWRLEAPVAADAERSTVAALVDAVAELRRKAAVEAGDGGADLARFGLAAPRARVRLGLEGGAEEALDLGDENAFDGSVFVRTTSGQVAVVEGAVRHAVERSALDLREKRLFPFEEADLAAVEVEAGTVRVRLVREAADAGAGAGWRLAEPRAGEADRATVERLLGSIRGLRAASFAPAPRWGERPRATVRLVDAKGAARTLRILAPAQPAPGAPARARLEGSAEEATLAAGALESLEADAAAAARPPPPPAAPDAGQARVDAGPFPP